MAGTENWKVRLRLGLLRHASRYVPASTSEVTMVGFRERQRATLIDKLPDTANVAIAGTLFGQAVSGQPFTIWLASDL
jgi:hypothetical protein